MIEQWEKLMNKYALFAVLTLVAASPAAAFAQEEYADTQAAQNWRQKWAQEKGALDDAAREQYEALSPEHKQQISERLRIGLERQRQKAGETGEAHGKKVSEAASEMAGDASHEFEEWKRGNGADATKYAGKAKKALEQLEDAQSSDEYHKRQKINDFKYKHMDEAHDIQRAYKDYAREHPGVDAAADSAKEWWTKRKSAQ